MEVRRRTPSMTRDDFLTWTELQRERYEFDGFEPVAMTGGNRDHSQICQNIYAALRSRLRGSGCVPLGPDAGVATVGDAVRYPDALVTCTKGPGTDLLMPGVVVVFEVVSATSGKTDRIDKVVEYRAVATIRRYIIVESASVALTVHSRAEGEEAWITAPLAGSDALLVPELGLTIPVTEFYEGTDLAS